MAKPIVFVCRKSMPKVAMDILEEKCEVRYWQDDKSVPREALLQQVASVDAILCLLGEKIDDELLDAAPNLKVVSTFSVGFDHIDVEACRKRNVHVGYTPNVLTETTAETALSLLLCTSRRLIEANKDVYEGRWIDWHPYYMCGTGIAGSTVGILGMGRIGCSIGEKVNAFHPAQLIYHNRKRAVEEIENKLDARYVSFVELLNESDFLIISCALTLETNHIINKSAFDKMKPNAILINISRGLVINQDDLYHALKNRKIKAAGLDVVYPEPLPKDHKLLTLDNIVVLPHLGSATVETRERMAILTARNIIAGLEGKPLPASAWR